MSFDLLEARPGFLLMNTETNNVEYITKEFIMDIAKAKGGLDGDGRPNSKSDYFKKTTLTVRIRRGKRVK